MRCNEGQGHFLFIFLAMFIFVIFTFHMRKINSGVKNAGHADEKFQRKHNIFQCQRGLSLGNCTSPIPSASPSHFVVMAGGRRSHGPSNFFPNQCIFGNFNVSSKSFILLLLAKRRVLNFIGKSLILAPLSTGTTTPLCYNMPS